jgi:hypothetical protein
MVLNDHDHACRIISLLPLSAPAGAAQAMPGHKARTATNTTKNLDITIDLY